jgi:ATP-dependent Lon protease
MSNKKIKHSSKKKLAKNKFHSLKLDFIKKTSSMKELVRTSILSIQNYKKLDIITASEYNICIQNLEEIYNNLNDIYISLKNAEKNTDYNNINDKLIEVKFKMIHVFKTNGTDNIQDLVNTLFEDNYLKSVITEDNQYLFNIIKKYFHPIKYKLLKWQNTKKNTKKNISKNRIVEDFMIIESAKDFDCFDLARTSQNYQLKVSGIKIAIHNEKNKETLIVSGIVDDMIISCLNEPYINERYNKLFEEKPTEPSFTTPDFKCFIDSLILKDYLVYNNQELYQRYLGYVNQTNLIKQKTISQIVKEFINAPLFSQRKTLIQLLMKKGEPEFQYLAYLLYDLLSNDTTSQIDTTEQTLLFDSLPWTIKKYFRDAMKNTMKYTKSLSNFDENQIPIEQQICLMKASDKIKEKAMNKLKEIKAKSEDSGSKARQYLDGLLKIPFGIFKTEETLTLMKTINCSFLKLLDFLEKSHGDIFESTFVKKNYYTILEIKKFITFLQINYVDFVGDKGCDNIINELVNCKRKQLIKHINFINTLMKKNNIKKEHISYSGKKNADMKEKIKEIIVKYKKDTNIMNPLIKKSNQKFPLYNNDTVLLHINSIEDSWTKMNGSIGEIHDTLDTSIHGHRNAKRQLERVIAQWITGKQTGYCFGFEGPPGVGKTSLARKGLAKCLKDKDGVVRPFSFIALGGSSNGSTLSGHNYTYVGSTWGKIVNILMDSKCMNPIIFIDELDKVSRTENGKEIIGILTHLIDNTQNECFQDKYFSGIDLNLSKALFVFSYNDVHAIDKVLLDRIHRIKFDNLTLEDKIVITNDYILPEIYDNMKLENTIEFSNECIEFIIETYTNESGVRKLKEILFEIVSEINLKILNHVDDQLVLPIDITIEQIKDNYLKERHEIIAKKIHTESTVGIINGLWANSLGMGGIIPIESMFIPSNHFLELKLTGMQGDVMKESMSVAKTLAWKLTPQKTQTKLLKKFEKNKLQGIHIHCPEGAVPKDGPSAGTAITVTIYSILNDKKIKHKLAITGEINLQGRVTAIGGLKLKILGGIKAGVKTFLFPVENQKDFNKFYDKHKEKEYLKDIEFIPVSNINEVLNIVFE